MSCRSAAASWLRDIEVQGIVTIQSGRPFTVALRPDLDNSNTGRSNLGFGNNDRPNVTGDPTLDSPTAEQWFNTAAFSLPAFGTFGNAGRNILTGPGYKNVNLAVIKYIPVGSAVRLQLRAEAFNLLNRINLDLPDAYLRLADLRPGAVGRQPAADPVWRESGILIGRGRARRRPQPSLESRRRRCTRVNRRVDVRSRRGFMPTRPHPSVPGAAQRFAAGSGRGAGARRRLARLARPGPHRRIV